jgi:hypothetical protein
MTIVCVSVLAKIDGNIYHAEALMGAAGAGPFPPNYFQLFRSGRPQVRPEKNEPMYLCVVILLVAEILHRDCDRNITHGAEEPEDNADDGCANDCFHHL